MQTLLDALTAQASKLEAANEEFVPATTPIGNADRNGASGWDPYEVWRVRIKEPQETYRSLRRPPK